MGTPHKLVFDLIQHHGDYVEFYVSYYLDYNLWTAVGIGWMSNNTPAYYLSSLKLNNFPAGNHYNKKANIHLQELSLKFQNDVLEDLALTNIRNQLLGTCKRARRSPR